MPGIGNQRHRSGEQAVGRLQHDKPGVERHANRKHAAEAGGGVDVAVVVPIPVPVPVLVVVVV